MTIRDLDDELFRRLEARAAWSGKTIGQALNEAIATYLAQPRPGGKSRSIGELQPIAYASGDERASERIDEIVFGPPKSSPGGASLEDVPVSD